jgi:bifunctional DNase/RNase
MTLMQIHEFTFCAQHKRGLIVLEDASQRLTLAFAVHPDEVPRLARMLKGAQRAFHPLHDFIQLLLDAFLVTPTDIILDDVPGKGLVALINVQRARTMLGIPCYAPDALALAGQMKLPIYATGRALMHAAPRSSSLGRGERELDGDVRAWLARVKPTDFHA